MTMPDTSASHSLGVAPSAPGSPLKPFGHAPIPNASFRVGDHVRTGDGYAGIVTAIDATLDRAYSVHILKGRGDQYGWWELTPLPVDVPARGIEREARACEAPRPKAEEPGRLADAPKDSALSDYQGLWEQAMSTLADIQAALGIPDDEAACANGSDVFVCAIEELKLAAPPSPQPATPTVEQSEREAFEAAIRAEYPTSAATGARLTLRRDMPGSTRFGQYVSEHIEFAWRIWLARAAIARATSGASNV